MKTSLRLNNVRAMKKEKTSECQGSESSEGSLKNRADRESRGKVVIIPCQKGVPFQ